MPSQADLIALVALSIGAPGVAQDAPPAGSGPRASSNEGERYDAVGYAGESGQPTGVAHPSLPLGSFVEVTALDSGRTALFAVTGVMTPKSDETIALSSDALRQLGLTAAGAPVRVRAARPSPPDIAALNAGRAAGPRLDAPAGLLGGLRKSLPVRAAALAAPRPAPAAVERKPSPVKPKPPLQQRPIDPPEKQTPVAPKPASAPASGWGVQVAALSDQGRARSLAARLGGSVRPAGKFWRVQLGPFADRKGAEAARANIVKRGHPQAALVHIP